MRDFSFVFEIYNLYFSIFQENYVVLLMNLSSINFNFSCSVMRPNHILGLGPDLRTRMVRGGINGYE